jgi:hypothetical protein
MSQPVSVVSELTGRTTAAMSAEAPAGGRHYPEAACLPKAIP